MRDPVTAKMGRRTGLQKETNAVQCWSKKENGRLLSALGIDLVRENLTVMTTKCTLHMIHKSGKG